MKIRIAARKGKEFRELYLDVEVLNQYGDTVYCKIGGYGKYLINIYTKPVMQTWNNGQDWIQFSLVK